MSDERDPDRIEDWAYAGRRFRHDGKMYHAWVTDLANPRDESLYLVRPKTHHIIGGFYTTEVWESEDGTTKRTGERTGKRAPEALARAWWAQDYAAQMQRQSKRDEAKEERRDLLDEALEPLMEIRARLTTRYEIDAFIATVTRRLSLGTLRKP